MAFWKRKKRKTNEADIPLQETELEKPMEPEEKEINDKKRRGKPQDYSRLTRNSQVKIRLTEDEVATLKGAASDAGMSLADYVMAGIKQERKIVLSGGIEIRNELVREGINLNQALALAHTARKSGTKVDMNPILRAAEKIEKNLDNLTELIVEWDIDLTETVKNRRGKKEGVEHADNENKEQ